MKTKATKKLKKTKKTTVKKGRFLLRHPLLVPVTTFIALFFVGLILLVFFGASTQGAADTRIVNLSFEGERRTVTTRAKTVGELIDRIDDIQLVEEDIVEPAKDSLILEDNTSINIYQARSVELVDGDRILTIFTAQTAPRLVAAEAGVELMPEDEVAFEPVDSTVLESTATEQLSIKRSVEIQLNLYGAVKTLRTTAGNVSELLEKEGIVPGENETVQPGYDSAIEPELLVSVNRPGIKTEIVEEDIAFKTETKDDSDLQAGTTRIEREGSDGVRAIIYEITEDEEGNEVSREELQSVVLKKAKNKIVLNGTKVVTPNFNSGTTVAGDKAALMAAAGIAESDFAFVDSIITKESQWRPFVANSSSGAYGLCQSLPASKMASAGADYLTNPVTQLKWCAGYAQGRYGGWANAYNAWEAQRWW